MSRNIPTPWEIYARHLAHLGYGYPLWHPAPEVDADYGPREVEIGSVGFVDEGRFRHLFNSLKPANDPFNESRVPEAFQPFHPPLRTVAGPEEAITQSCLTSHSIQQIGGSAALDVSSPESLVTAGGMLRFNCTDDSGAFLFLEPPGISWKITSKRHIVTYLQKNFDHWFKYATQDPGGPGFDLTPEQLVFVSGTIKTTRWACSAFSGNYRDKEGSISCDITGVANAEISLSISNHRLPSHFVNHGPRSSQLSPDTTRISARSEGQVTASGEELSGQHCIFIHYFKVKKRFWKPRVLQATAGPHELPPPDRSMHEGTTSLVQNEEAWSEEPDFEEVPAPSQTYDPVVALLDYILDRSHAHMAIASDNDLHVLRAAYGVPEGDAMDIAQLSPKVEVDEHGVGTIGVNSANVPMPQSIADLYMFAHSDRETSDGTPSLADGNPSTNESNAFPSGPDLAPHNGGGEPQEGSSRALAATHHTSAVTTLTVSSDSNWIASGSEDRSVIVWSAADQTHVHTLTSHRDVVFSLAFAPDSTRLASGAEDGTMIVWDVVVGSQLVFLKAHTACIRTITWSPDGSRLLSGSDDCTIRVWDALTYRKIHELHGHTAIILFMCFSPDGLRLASCSADYTCRVWDFPSLSLHKELKGHDGVVWSAAFDPLSRRLATACDDGSVFVWSVVTGESLLTLQHHHAPVWVVQFSLDGKELLSASSDATVKIYNSYSGEGLLSLEDHDGAVTSASFSPEGKYIASGCADGVVRLWKRRDGSCIVRYNEHNDKVTQVVFSPDSTTLSSGSEDGTICIRPVLTRV